MAIKVEVEFDREKLREYVLDAIRKETRLPLTGADPQQIAEDVARLMGSPGLVSPGASTPVPRLVRVDGR